MDKPEKVFRTRFKERQCPKCRKEIIPVVKGSSCEMHGYRLDCTLCNAFIGWGGKTYFPEKAV